MTSEERLVRLVMVLCLRRLWRETWRPDSWGPGLCLVEETLELITLPFSIFSSSSKREKLGLMCKGRDELWGVSSCCHAPLLWVCCPCWWWWCGELVVWYLKCSPLPPVNDAGLLGPGLLSGITFCIETRMVSPWLCRLLNWRMEERESGLSPSGKWDLDLDVVLLSESPMWLLLELLAWGWWCVLSFLWL